MVLRSVNNRVVTWQAIEDAMDRLSDRTIILGAEVRLGCVAVNCGIEDLAFSNIAEGVITTNVDRLLKQSIVPAVQEVSM